MRIAVFGGDGFVGWPTCLHLSNAGHESHHLRQSQPPSNRYRARVQSLTPIGSIQEVKIGKVVSGCTNAF